MKYEYVTATGKNEVEVDERFIGILREMDREEYNSDRRHCRHNPISLSHADYDREWMMDKEDAFYDLVEAEDYEKLQAALALLTTDQRSLIQDVYFRGVLPSEIARRDGVHNSAISNRLARAMKRLRLFLDRP
jgi:RNA polymerase sigma factor (sigma-70 family)